VAVIVDSAVYRKGERVDVACQIQDYAALQLAACQEHDFVWVAPGHGRRFQARDPEEMRRELRRLIARM